MIVTGISSSLLELTWKISVVVPQSALIVILLCHPLVDVRTYDFHRLSPSTDHLNSSFGQQYESLKDVAAGTMVTALEEAQVAARGDPRKEKIRLKRQEERSELQRLKDTEAFGRLSKAGFQLRAEAATKRRAAQGRRVAVCLGVLQCVAVCV